MDTVTHIPGRRSTACWRASTVLSAAVALGVTMAAPAASQTDVEYVGLCRAATTDELIFDDTFGSPHHEAIDCLVHLGIVERADDVRFHPNAPVRRDQIASLVDRTVEVLVDRFDDLEPEDAEAREFRDVESSVHRESIERSATRGYVLGHDDGTFRPRGLLTRGQLASIVVRVHEDLVGPIENEVEGAPDSDGSPHDRSIRKARYAELMQGYEDGTFRSEDPVTRAQAATVVRNLGQRVVEAS